MRAAHRVRAEGAAVSTDDLIVANRAAIKEGLNRTLKPAALRQLRRDQLWPIVLAFPHAWRHMKPYEPHLRLMIDVVDTVGSHTLFVDVPAPLIGEVVTFRGSEGK
jgi:hypothetical protein